MDAPRSLFEAVAEKCLIHKRRGAHGSDRLEEEEPILQRSEVACWALIHPKMLSLEHGEGWRVMQESAKALRQIPCHDLMTFLVSRATLAVEPSLNLVASDTICAIFVSLIQTLLFCYC